MSQVECTQKSLSRHWHMSKQLRDAKKDANRLIVELSQSWAFLKEATYDAPEGTEPMILRPRFQRLNHSATMPRVRLMYYCENINNSEYKTSTKHDFSLIVKLTPIVYNKNQQPWTHHEVEPVGFNLIKR